MELEVNSIEQIWMATRYIEKCENVNIERTWRDYHHLERVKKLFLDEITKTNITLEKAIKLTNEIISKNILKNEHIQQSFTNDRFINFCWTYLYCLYFNEVLANRFIPRQLRNNNEILKRNTCKAPFSRHDSGIKQRKTSLLDAIQFADTTMMDKKETIEILKTLWSHTRTSKINFTWLDIQNAQHIEWAYEYILKIARSNIPFTPQCIEDKYWAFIATLDLEIREDFIELFLLKFKKTFSQMKYREKHKELKFYSIGMTSDTKEKLDKMVKHKDTKIHKLIEQLIESEHRKTFG